jgi:hypothetical protein
MKNYQDHLPYVRSFAYQQILSAIAIEDYVLLSLACYGIHIQPILESESVVRANAVLPAFCQAGDVRYVGQVLEEFIRTVLYVPGVSQFTISIISLLVS